MDYKNHKHIFEKFLRLQLKDAKLIICTNKDNGSMIEYLHLISSKNYKEIQNKHLLILENTFHYSSAKDFINGDIFIDHNLKKSINDIFSPLNYSNDESKIISHEILYPIINEILVTHKIDPKYFPNNDGFGFELVFQARNPETRYHSPCLRRGDYTITNLF